MAEEVKNCPNCRRDIPSQSYMMHTLHCARNIAVCKHCDEPIPRAELEEHMERKVCELCGKQVEACKMEEHQKSECPKRTTLCKWCATHVEMGSLEEHEDYCGSRTEKCEQCGEFIMLKNFEAHLNSNQCRPKPSWERKSSLVPATPSYSSYTSQTKSSLAAETSASTSSQRSTYSNSQDIYSSRRFNSARSSSITRSTSSSLVSSALSKANMSVAESHSESRTEARTEARTETSTDDSTILLPCEFCNKPIPSFKLLSHQAECVNPNNVRTSSSSRYTRAASITRSYSLTSASSSSRVNKYCETESTSKTQTESTSGTASGTVSRKVSPTSKSSSIVSKFLSSPAERSNGYDSSSHSSRHVPDSPPSSRDYSGSSYVGRSSYLMEESRRERQEVKKSESKASVPSAPGLYENDTDREGLRQMLSSLRRDPMDVEEDPDNNDGTFFPCEFCGDPYPCEFLMRHQISCDLNPQPVSSGQGFDYSAIKRNIGDHLGVTENSSSSSNYGRRKVADTAEDISRETRRMSRSNSVVDRSYGRSTVRNKRHA